MCVESVTNPKFRVAGSVLNPLIVSVLFLPIHINNQSYTYAADSESVVGIEVNTV